MFKKVCMTLTLGLLCLIAWADYSVDFEGAGETKGSYAAGNVTLSGIEWNMTEVMIGTDPGEAVNGARAARLRGHGTSVMTMLQNKTDGIGNISFYHKRYNTNDPSIDWKVEYSTNNGASWQQAGPNFSPTNEVNTFIAEVNVTGNARIRILPVSYTGSSNRRINIDDILITDYIANLPTITLAPNILSGFTYDQNHGPSAAQTYTLSAENLSPASGNISISASDVYEFSTTGSAYQSTLSIPYSGASLSPVTIYVRLKAGLAHSDYTQNATHSGGGATAYLGLSGNVTLSVLPFSGSYSQDFTDFVSLNTLPNGWCVDEDIPYIGDFDHLPTGGLRGNGVLGMQVTATAPNDSLTATLSFANTTGSPINSLAISYMGKVAKDDQPGSPKWIVSVNDTVIPELEYDTAEGINSPRSAIVSGLNIAVADTFTVSWFTTSTGTQGTRKQIGIDDVLVSIHTSDEPALHLTGQLNPFETQHEYPSTSQGYLLHGSNLTSDITVQAPTGFELSTDDVNFSSQLQLDRSFNGCIHVRLSGANIGTFSGNITHSSSGAANQLLPVSGTVSSGSGGFTQDLFISEYIEGSSHNKAIEIYNGTASPIDLSNYVVELYSNGNTTANSSFSPNAILNPGQCYVIVHTSAGSSLSALADVKHGGVCAFNGNDAIVLAKTNPRSIVDIFGVIGHDPGTAWTDGDHSTKDKTLVRKSTVAQGVTINPGGTEFTTLATEWDLYDVDTFTYLGYHDCDASGYEVQAPTIQAHSLIAYPSHDEITLEWSAGNGTKRVIYVNTINSFTPPADGDNPTPNTVYASGQQCVYNQSTPIIEDQPVNACRITNLQPQTQYWFRIYEYNGEGTQTKFLLSEAANNPLSAITTEHIVETGYYAEVTGYGQTLKSSLHQLIRTTHTTRFSYDALWTQLPYTDEDPNNPNNIIEIYTGWSVPKSHAGGGTTQWNREHTWSKSHGGFGDSAPAGTDLHHMRPCDATVNSAKSNRDFDNGGTLYIDASPPSGYSGDTGCYSSPSNTWEPRDEDKGDVARMMMYMAVRYEGTDTSFDLELVDAIDTSGPNYGKLSTLLAWHVQDPPDAREMQRNERIFERQGNRNPFIDKPEYAAHIWSPIPQAAQNISQSGFRASWTTPIDASRYYLQVATDSLFVNVLPAYNDLNVYLNNSLLISGLSNDHTYYYRLKSYFQSGYSMYSPFMRVELLSSAEASLSSDIPMDEYNLDAVQLTLSLQGCTFSSTNLDPAHFSLLGAPVGLSIQSIQYLSPGSAAISLSFDGSDFDANHYLQIQISPSAISAPTTLTSNSLKITAYVETTLTISISGNQLSLQLSPVANSAGYKVFSSPDPYSLFTECTQAGSFQAANPLIWLQTDPPQIRGFYRAAAFRE